MLTKGNFLIHDGVELPLVRGFRIDFRDFLVKTIAERIARQVMPLDDHAKVLVLEIDGRFTRIVDGEVDTDGVAMMKDRSFITARIGDFESGHQAVGRGEVVGEETLDFYIAHLVGL